MSAGSVVQPSSVLHGGPQTTPTVGPYRKSLPSLSKACNLITQLEQHSHIRKPCVERRVVWLQTLVQKRDKDGSMVRKYNRRRVGRRLVVVVGRWRRMEGVWACVNERGWGLVVGECSEGMSGKAGIPQSSFRSLCDSVGSPTQCMAVPSSRRRLLQQQQMSGGREGRTKDERDEPSLTSPVSQTHRILHKTEQDRPGPQSNNESCLERVCYLVVRCLLNVS